MLPMRSSSIAVLVALVATLSPVVAGAVGESIGGFPNYHERVLHQLVNRSRVDPQLALAGCGANCSEAVCYGPIAPLYYEGALNRAARFHADEMAAQGFFGHDSTCTLVDAIAETYPDTCDGAAACACIGGVSTCMPTCDTAQERVSKWGVAQLGESIAVGVSPEVVFDGWLFQDAKGVVDCQLHPDNADRIGLLTLGSSIGFGVAGGYTVAEFGSPGVEHKIASGSHWPREGPTVEVWANWFEPINGLPKSARVNVDGVCSTMELARGDSSNGAYTVTLDGLEPGCHRYYFEFIDGDGITVTYPTAGSLGIGPEQSCPDWAEERPFECGCQPACTISQTCINGTCCTPQCRADQCGPDGCGGECLVCGEGYHCSFDFCAPDGSSSDSGDPTTAATTSSTSATSESSTTDGSDSLTMSSATVGSDGASATGVSAGPGGDGKSTGCECRYVSTTSPWWAIVFICTRRRRRHAT